MDKLLAALRRNRHGHRVGLVRLIIYSHGLRVFRGFRSSSRNGALNKTVLSPVHPKQRCRFTGLGHFRPGTLDG